MPRATFKYPNFQFSCKLSKKCNYNLRPTFKNPTFESMDGLGKKREFT